MSILESPEENEEADYFETLKTSRLKAQQEKIMNCVKFVKGLNFTEQEKIVHDILFSKKQY